VLHLADEGATTPQIFLVEVFLVEIQATWACISNILRLFI